MIETGIERIGPRLRAVDALIPSVTRELRHALWGGCGLDSAACGHRDLLGAKSCIGGCIIPPLDDEHAHGLSDPGAYVLGMLSGWGLVELIKKLF